jgi:isochorismate pyruvate lyase
MNSESIVPASDCSTMAEVRAGVDHLDAEIVKLLGQRMRYMDAAARIKQHRDDIRDEPRKAAVIEHACEVAREEGVPELLVRQLYEVLVEASIAYELDRFERR